MNRKVVQASRPPYGWGEAVLWEFRLRKSSRGFVLTLMPSTKAKPRTIDEYLAGVNTDQRAALEKLRQTIRAAAPKVEEYISYGLAAFRLNGRPLVAFGAAKKHCAFYPMNATTVAAFQDQLKGYETSKGTIRFSTDKPLPTALVKTLVTARIAENGG
jgi:uncharacterized protein YdhG (YjbR/CyaY superfamily)